MVVTKAGNYLRFDLPTYLSWGISPTHLHQPKNGLHLRHYLLSERR
jgi:hypothetical protein